MMSSQTESSSDASVDRPSRSWLRKWPWALLGAVCLAGLTGIGLWNFLLFHVLAEGFSIVVATSTFLVVWHTRRASHSGFLVVLGSAYLCVAGLDSLHTLAYRGMGLFEGDTTNEATQLWLAVRLIEASALLVSVRHINRSLPIRSVLALFVGLFVAVTAMVVLGLLPATWAQGRLTPVKIAGELVVIALLAGALWQARRHQDQFEPRLVGYMYGAILLTMASEALFALYADPHGPVNMAGHLLKVGSFWMVYRLLIESALRRPYAVLYRDLSKSQEDLRRTAANLARQGAFLRALVDHTPVGVAALRGPDLRVVLANPAYCRYCDRPCSEVVGATWEELFDTPEAKRLARQVREVMASDQPMHMREIPGTLVSRPQRSWWSVYLVPLREGKDREPSLLVLVEDMTQSVEVREELVELSRTLEKRVAERTAEAETRATQLRAMALELTGAEQRERRNLAQMLHDHLQQLLVGAKFHLQALGGRAPQSAQAVGEIQSLLDQSLEVTRSATYELCPPMLQDEGLAATLEWLGGWMRDKQGLEVRAKVEEESNPSNPIVCAFMFQAARELLFNVVKHSRSQSATVWLRRIEDNRIELTVADQGRGFDPEDVEDEGTGGFGLHSIRERLGFLGGQMEVDSAPGEGTRIRLWAPLETDAESRPAMNADR
jgi:signal transduction histidine kinase